MLTVYTDGGARGNPGPAGYGVHVVDGDGTVVAELYAPIGTATNNVAEYRGLIAALEWALEHDVRSIRVRMDSELIVNQMLGRYKVKHPGLHPLHAEARSLVTRLGRVSFEHVRREANREADRLSNLAMDLAEGKRHPAGPPRAAMATHDDSPAVTGPTSHVGRQHGKPHGTHRARAVRLDFDA